MKTIPILKAIPQATIFLVFVTMTFGGWSSGYQKDVPSVETKPLTVFLVRHAEKAEVGDDPELSDAGHDRVNLLVQLLGDSEIEHVHSSDYARTKGTASPVASKHNLEVQLYDPRDLPALVKKLRDSGGRHLVVGHSNTTPDVVELLGGKPGTPIDEPGEYDRLYIVTIAGDGDASTVLLRYGKPFVPK